MDNNKISNSINSGADSLENSLSLNGLTAVIIGSTIGSGIFTITGDMAAAGAHTGAILIGWAICGAGMLGLMMCYFGLNKIRPDLTNGVYSYACEGFGEYIGFNSVWGYWASALLCNVSYMTLLFGAIGHFIPAFENGNNLLSILSASVLLWIINRLVLKGVKEAASLNIITTFAKLIPLFIFIAAILSLKKFNPDNFMQTFWGDGSMSISNQIKATTSATVWSFIGIEGAVVLSGRARNPSDVGKSSIIAFAAILSIYVLTAVLSMGVLPNDALSKLESPQMAAILSHAVGPWGAAIINIGVILSLAGALLGWTILAADCPYSAATQGVFTKSFTHTNVNGAPSFCLNLTNGIIQFFLIVCYFSSSTYQAFYALSTSMIMFPYLLSAAYYLKIAIKKEGFENLPRRSLLSARIFGFIGTIYGIWMLYSGGLDYVLITTVLYAPGLIVFIRGRKEKKLPVFSSKAEIAVAVVILMLAVISTFLMITRNLNLL